MKTETGDYINLIHLGELMKITSGSPDIIIGLLDGPVDLSHPALSESSIQLSEDIVNTAPSECIHGTFIAGIIAGRRNTMVTAIAPKSHVIAYPIFSRRQAHGTSLTADVNDVAEAINQCITNGTHIINISAVLTGANSKEHIHLKAALDRAEKAGVLVLAAAGNQRARTGTALTNHTAVIPIISYDSAGLPSKDTPISRIFALRGLGAPGVNVPGVGPDGRQLTMSGTSIATAFITGVASLLYGTFPNTTLQQLKYALIKSPTAKRSTIFPPLVNALNAYKILTTLNRGKF